MRRLLAFVGFFFFCFGILFFVNFYQSNGEARILDKPLIPPERPETPNLCLDNLETEYQLARRVMSERESQALTVSITNNSELDCELGVALTVSPADFVISPLESTLKVEVLAERTNEIIWIISPLRTGSFSLAVAVEDQAQQLGVTVTNVLGLTVFQAQIVSLLGTIFGPIFTVPWWIEWWQKRRGKKKE